MARSPLTLAAAVASALPGAEATSTAALSAGGAGRCDAALVGLADGRQVVVRAPSDDEANRELAAEALALRALTPGVRGLLTFRAPELLGQAGLGDARALVTDYIPGYHVDAAEVPPGDGVATAIGRALASLHALPPSIVRAEGLAQRSPAEVRDEVRELIARAGETGKVPVRLTVRWRDTIEADEVWRFESTVTLGGAGATSFLYEDRDDRPEVAAVLEWHGLAVGDPAVDLHWLASAPTAAGDIIAAYTEAAHRAPDAHLQTRARLYAELEFARWLVHGHDTHQPEVVDDAAELLEALAEGVSADPMLRPQQAAPAGVDDAIALLGRVPEAATAPAVDTSMQTDTYDPAMLSVFADDVEDGAADADASDPAGSTDAEDSAGATYGAAATTGAPGGNDTAPIDENETAPIDLSEWASTHLEPGGVPHPETDQPLSDDELEAERAARAAIQRWASSGSE